MKIPQSIINKADTIMKNARRNAELEKEIISWIKSKGVELDDMSDIVACLMYAEYENGEHFADVLSVEMSIGKII